MNMRIKTISVRYTYLQAINPKVNVIPLTMRNLVGAG